ncbi:MAG: amidohydrolase family protein [Pseudomonadota bacterium]
MKKKKLTIAAGIALASAMAPAFSADIAILHAGRLIATPGAPATVNQTVVIRDGKIEAVRNGFVDASALDAGADDTVTVHNLKTMTVLPGLIDGHVHITSENNPKGRLQRVEMSEGDTAIAAAGFARKTLLAGFTTVRDVGAGSSDAVFALRDGIVRGDVIGPRVFSSGSTISVTGGHGDGTQGYRDDVAKLLHQTGVCNGVGDCRRAVREQVRRGADHIKLTATAGVLSNTAAGLEQQFFEDELKAIMDTAHAMGRRVTAHAHGVEGVKAALRAGVDAIEHGTYSDDEAFALFKRKGAYLVPTLLAGATVVEWAKDPNSFLLAPQRAKALQAGPEMLDMVRRAHNSGVKIAFGTDSGVSRHGDNAREFALMVEAGMSPMQAIRAATIVGAENLGRTDTLGSIAPGKYGDIIAVDGDPLADIRELEDVDFVMKGGVVYKAP